MAPQSEYQVVVIGAGVAGLAAAQRLRAAGLDPLVIEARNRVGGRIWTDHTYAPVELGAEFIHGEYAATWHLIKAAGLPTEAWPRPSGSSEEFRRLSRQGTVLPDDSLSAQVEHLYERIQQYDGPDRSVAEVLPTLTQPDDEAIPFIMNRLACMEAADVTRLSALAIAQERAQNTAGWDNFHISTGYDRLPAFLAQDLNIRYDTAVTQVTWDEQAAHLSLASGPDLVTRQVIITVPLGLLQNDYPRFAPPLPLAKQQAIGVLAMGHVTKLVLWFKRQVWPPFTFLGTDGFVFTWWPVGTSEQPALMGYTGGPGALRLAALGSEAAIAQGLQEASQLFGPEVHQAFISGKLVDWSTDPWSRGAYTYTPVGAVTARIELAKPLAPTLFFAGEATSTNGHLATVHGAIETGWRAADEVLKIRSSSYSNY